jgi:broad specificity phosphatase PhoE
MGLTFILTRHGQTDDNITQTLQGWRDTSLTPSGHADAQTLASKLLSLYPHGINAVYHSPLERIRDTIAPYLALYDQQGGKLDAGITEKPAIHSDGDLRGQYLGSLEGQSYDKIDMSSPRSADAVEGVEVFDEFVARLLRVFGQIVGREAALVAGSEGGEGRERVVMIATHGVGITSLFKALEASKPCDGFGSAVARRGSEAYEVKWTDADDVAKIRVEDVEALRRHVRQGDGTPKGAGSLDWESLRKAGEKPFEILAWGKKEKSLLGAEKNLA